MNERDGILWYKNAVFYGLEVATFQDSNGDGIGDFPGLISRLDSVADLGVTCLWLLRFFPSPNRDNAQRALTAPLVTKGQFNYRHINVDRQAADPDWTLNIVKRLIRLRCRCPEWGWGT